MKRVSKKYGKGKKRTYKKRTYKKKGKKTSFSKRVRAVVYRATETKYATYNLTNVMYPAPLQGTANTNGLSQNIMAMVPTLPVGSPASNLPAGSCIAGVYIGNGAGVNNRIGNKITTSRAVFRYTISQVPQNATTYAAPQPVFVKFFLVKSKQSPLTPPTQAMLGGANGTFFSLGANTAGFNANTMDVLQTINHDDWTLLATKTFKVGPAAYTGAGAQGSFEYFQNNDFKLACMGKWDITKYLPKTIDFDDVDNSTNATPWLIVQVVPAVPALSFSAATLPIQIDYQYLFDYKDM
jgi:hypothetical protein